MTTPRNPQLIVPGHTLVSEGAAFNEDRTKAHRWHTGVSGVGRGLCSCGALSDILTSAYSRKAWHRHHKTEVTR